MAAGVDRETLAPYIQRYLTPQDAIAHPQPLLSGQDLIETLGLPRGPEIGHWLTEIAIAHAEGQIQTPAEAIAWVKQHYPKP